MTGPSVAPGAAVFRQAAADAAPWTAKAPKLTGRAAELRARITPAAALGLGQSSDYLVKGWLDRGALSVLYGQPGAGKTFFALDIAAHVTAGEPWRGARVRRCAVLYVATEGGGGFKRRLDVLDDAEGLHVLPEAVRLDDPAEAAALAEAAGAIDDLGLIVIDTLARCFSGDENAAADIGRFVAGADLLRERRGAHVMIVHHAGKNLDKGARGSIALKGACDTEIELTRDEAGVITARCTKQRDQEEPPSITFRLERVELGEDADGDPITSARLVASDAPAGAPRRKPLGANERAMLEALAEFALAHGAPNPSGVGFPESGRVRTVERDAFVAFARDRLSHSDADTRRRSVDRALGNLIAKGLIAANAGRLWRVETPDARRTFVQERPPSDDFAEPESEGLKATPNSPFAPDADGHSLKIDVRNVRPGGAADEC